MGFQLTIAEGKESGRKFLFDQAQVLIGRNSECDVVLYDPGVSRQHARIYADGDNYFVEDMGSANGTKVNGELVRKVRLRDGDAVCLGPVVFNFYQVEDNLPVPTAGAQSTRIVAAERRARGRGVALAPKNADREDLHRMERRTTQSMQAIRERSAARRSLEEVPRPGRRTLSAADRARIRRESGALLAPLKLFWYGASDQVRLALLALGAVAGVALLGLLAYLILAPNRTRRVAEPDQLTRETLPYSFGHGDVDFERPEDKAFKFELNTPLSALVLLRFASKDISQGEVVINVNGMEVGFVPPDGVDAGERTHEVVIHPRFLQKGKVNLVAFDNARNPPRQDRWAVSNLSMETFLIPQKPPPQILEDAQVQYDRAKKMLEMAPVGPANRYNAWRDFRKAWLLTESLADPKPELHALAREGMKQAWEQMDDVCRQLMRQAYTAFNSQNYKEAKATLDHVNSYFPSHEHPCKKQAEEKLIEYEL